MDCYIARLMRLGFSLPDAFKKYDEYVCRGMLEEFDAYITEMEADGIPIEG